MTSLTRRHRRLLAAATAALLAGGLGSAVALTAGAGAATVLGDDFEDGDAAGWSKSGGDWAVERDGSLVLHQAKATSELARQFRGSADWTDYAVQARVAVTAGSADGFAGIAARAAGSTTYVRLVVRSRRAELQSVRSGRVSGLGSVAVPAGRWSLLRLEVTGDQVRGFVDGSAVGAGTTATPPVTS